MKIAYLTSRYPAVSHTFIRREVAMLRRKGIPVETFSVRRAEEEDVPSSDDRDERERTWSILPIGPLDFLSSHLRTATRKPVSYLKTLALALSERPRGVRAFVWSLLYFGEAVPLARELERRSVSHLHNHFANAGGDVGFLASKLSGIPWSVTLHGTADFEGPPHLLGRKIVDSEFAVCVSHFGRAQALRVVPKEHWDKVIVARCGVELGQIPERAPGRDDGAPARVLTVGRLSSEKGHVGLVDAFDAAFRDRDVELHVVGSGPELSDIQQEVARRGLDNRVKFLGALSARDVLLQMANADVFALPSLMEGLPVVLMEAMAVGVPVVAPRLSGIPELVEDGVSGLLFTPANWRELGEKMALALDDRALRQRLVRAARAKVEGEFSIDEAVAPLFERFGGRDVGHGEPGSP